ncbi:MAG: metallophosphoesterase [bacterium]
MEYLYILIYYLSYFIFLFIFYIGYCFFREKKIKKIAVFIIIIISLVFIYARFIEPKMLIEKTADLSSITENALGIKAVIFSDLHIGVYKNTVSLEKIADKTNEQYPDIVFIPGDFIYNISKDDIEKKLSPIAKIKAPVYAVTGNHDKSIKSNLETEVEDALEKYGAHIINNKMEKINIKGTEIILIGLRDLWSGDINFQLLNGLPNDVYSIALAHNPDSVYYFPANCNVDLVISGHTHGGQIRLPYIYKYVIPTAHDFDKGFYNVKGINVFVSPGVGMTGIPLRFLMPPELDILYF